MKIPELKLGQVVAVAWVDVNSNLGWSYNPNKPRKLAEIASIGYVVQRTEDILTLTTSMDTRGATIDDLSIPAGCIQQIEIIPNCGFMQHKETKVDNARANMPIQNPDIQDLLDTQGSSALPEVRRRGRTR